MKRLHYFAVTLMVLLLTFRLSEGTVYVDRQAQALRQDDQGLMSSFGEVPWYTIEGHLDPNTRVLQGALLASYANRTGTALSDLAFRLLPDASSIYGGGLDVHSVTYNDQPVDFQLALGDTVMRVSLAPPWPRARRHLSKSISPPVCPAGQSRATASSTGPMG